MDVIRVFDSDPRVPAFVQDQSARVLFDVAIQPPMPQQFFSPICGRLVKKRPKRRWSESDEIMFD